MDQMETEEEIFEYKPSFVLIAIDTHPSMFVKTEETDSLFEMSIKTCYEIADSLILTQNNRSWNQFAIVLANEDNKASLIDFNKNILESVKILKEESSLNHSDLVKKYQRNGPFDLGSFFLYCKKKYKEIKSQFYKRTIIYITNDDDPVGGDKNKRFTALNEVKNLDAMDIIMEMITMNPQFDYKLFYNELFAQMHSAPKYDQLVTDQEGLMDKLSSSIVFRHSQRKLEFYPFKGDDKRFLKVIQKKTIAPLKLYNNAFVSGDKIVKKFILKEEIGAPTYKLSFSTETVESIEFNATEYSELFNNLLPIGYTLLNVSDRVTDIGFTASASVILEFDNKEDPQFIDYFKNFWKYCVEFNKVLICVRKLKQNDKIRFVELIPKLANNQPIFMVKAIPFASEIHYPPTDAKKLKQEIEDHEITDEQKNVMNDLIEKLSFDYYPQMFPNPSLAKKKAFLKAKLLGEKLEEVEDVTLDVAETDRVIEDVAANFNKVFVKETVGQKRKKSEPAKKRAARKTK